MDLNKNLKANISNPSDISNLEVDRYLSMLSTIQEGTNEYVILNSILLLSYKVYHDLIILLASNEVTLEDLGKLKVINDDTVFEFIYRVQHNTEQAVEYRRHFINEMRDTYNINEKIKYPLLNNYKLFLKQYFTSINNYTIPVDVGIVNTYKNFQVVTNMYNEAISHPKDEYGNFMLNEPLNNAYLNEKLDDLKEKTSFLSFEFNLFLNLAIEITDNPILMASSYNPHGLEKYPSILFIFKQMYNYVSPTNYDNVYNMLLDDMVDNYDVNNIETVTGLLTIKKFYEDYDIIVLDSEDMRYDITDNYISYQLLRYHYPKMFNEQFAYIEKDELIYNKLEMEELRLYLEEVRKYFEEVRKVAKGVFYPNANK